MRVNRLVLIAAAGEFKAEPHLRLLLRAPNQKACRHITPLTRGWLGRRPMS